MPEKKVVRKIFGPKKDAVGYLGHDITRYFVFRWDNKMYDVRLQGLGM